MTAPTYQTSYDHHKRMILTHIAGDVDSSTIESWGNSLSETLNKIPGNTSFRIFINLFGFKAIDLDAHKKFRTIIPLTLAQYDWRVGYVDLFPEEAKEFNTTSTRGIRCVAAAHSHHDETKMELYETKFSRQNEHFFTDPVAARNWLEQYNN